MCRLWGNDLPIPWKCYRPEILFRSCATAGLPTVKILCDENVQKGLLQECLRLLLKKVSPRNLPCLPCRIGIALTQTRKHSEAVWFLGSSHFFKGAAMDNITNLRSSESEPRLSSESWVTQAPELELTRFSPWSHWTPSLTKVFLKMDPTIQDIAISLVNKGHSFLFHQQKTWWDSCSLSLAY